MRDSKNKAELFHFIADRISDMDTVDPVIVTKEDLVLSNHEIRLDDISPCSHEEVAAWRYISMQPRRGGYWYVCTCQACGTGRLQSPHD